MPPTRPDAATSPPTTAIRERVRAGELLLGAFIQLGSPMAAELAGRAGLDWLLVDLEHGAATEASLAAHLTSIESTGAAAIVRVEEGTRLRIGRALDLGAEGVMIPRLEEPTDVRRVASWLRYPPDGLRGVALTTRGAGLGEVGHGDVRTLNDRVLGVIQIESAAAVENASAIAGIDGIDVLFVGPSDLSHSLGIPGKVTEPAFERAIRSVAAACRAEGVAAGVLVKQAADARRYIDLGYTFVGLGSDSGFVVEGARSALATIRGG